MQKDSVFISFLVCLWNTNKMMSVIFCSRPLIHPVPVCAELAERSPQMTLLWSKHSQLAFHCGTNMFLLSDAVTPQQMFLRIKR